MINHGRIQEIMLYGYAARCEIDYVENAWIVVDDYRLVANEMQIAEALYVLDIGWSE